MRAKRSAWLAASAIPVLTTANQLCIKMLAGELVALNSFEAQVVAALHSRWLPGILLSEIFGFVLWMEVLSHLNISKAIPISALSYISIIAVGTLWLHEPLRPLQIIGSVLILAGVWLIGTADRPHSEKVS